MRVASMLLLVAMSTSCGGNEKTATDQPRSTGTPTAQATAGDQETTCKKLGRTWVVAAEKLKPSLVLAVPDRVKESTDAMTEAGDQMKIEGCSVVLQQPVLLGNYQAALAAADATICAQKFGDSIRACTKAGDEWQENGVPLIDQVRTLSAS